MCPLIRAGDSAVGSVGGHLLLAGHCTASLQLGRRHGCAVRSSQVLLELGSSLAASLHRRAPTKSSIWCAQSHEPLASTYETCILRFAAPKCTNPFVARLPFNTLNLHCHLNTYIEFLNIVSMDRHVCSSNMSLMELFHAASAMK